MSRKIQELSKKEKKKRRKWFASLPGTTCYYHTNIKDSFGNTVMQLIEGKWDGEKFVSIDPYTCFITEVRKKDWIFNLTPII